MELSKKGINLAPEVVKSYEFGCVRRLEGIFYILELAVVFMKVGEILYTRITAIFVPLDVV
ncbi:hypothetical protein ES703_26409 [subsurface metagenome]